VEGFAGKPVGGAGVSSGVRAVCGAYETSVENPAQAPEIHPQVTRKSLFWGIYLAFWQLRDCLREIKITRV